MPVLSVGMPVFNGARWIEDALESILGQAYRDLELIIADNASDDDTEAICRRAAERDGRVRYVRNEANLGIYENFNRVYRLSSGKYFKWAACSDICLDGFFEKCVAVLDARPDVVLAYPKAFLLVDHPLGKVVAQPYEDNLNIEDDNPSQRFIEYLNRERINNVMHGVIRAASLEGTALHLPLPGSDISLVAELSLRGKFVEIPDRLFLRRFNAETSSLLMTRETAKRLATPHEKSIVGRIKLHSYRFVTAAKAPISFGDKCKVWWYLVGRVAMLRHQVIRKLIRIVMPAR